MDKPRRTLRVCHNCDKVYAEAIAKAALLEVSPLAQEDECQEKP